MKKLAEGYPIFIHNDLPFADLQRQYAAMAAGCVPVVIAEADQTEIVTDARVGCFGRTLPSYRPLPSA